VRWRKHEDGSWRSTNEQRTSLALVFIAAEQALQAAASDFANLFFSQYPEYGPGRLVGVSGLAFEQLACDPACIPERAIAYIWEERGTFEFQQSDIENAVKDFEDFIEQSTISLRFQAQLLNFHMPATALSLTGALRIRRLDEREISKFHGDPFARGRHPFDHPIHEFILEGEYLGKKVMHGERADTLAAKDTATSLLDKAILSLRTFKDGPVGYDWVHFKFVKFCPLVLPSYGSLELQLRAGIYQLLEQDTPALAEHTRQIFALSESALETACARLAYAETRFRPQDQLLDAVIGLEALLLAGDPKNELSLRFSLNYSTLFDSPEKRLRAYRIARDLYKNRSIIAHGGKVSVNSISVGEEKLNLNAAAKLAKDALRNLIKHFLPQAKTAPYKSPQFWEQAYFQMPAPTTAESSSGTNFARSPTS